MSARTPNDWTINDDGHLVQSDGSCFNLDDAASILTDYDATLDTLRAENARLREALAQAEHDRDVWLGDYRVLTGKFGAITAQCDGLRDALELIAANTSNCIQQCRAENNASLLRVHATVVSVQIMSRAALAEGGE